MSERRPLSASKYSFLRKKIGTQAEVARLLGVRQSVISKRERGLSAISVEASLALERLLADCVRKPAPVRVRLDSPEGRAVGKAISRKRDAESVVSGRVSLAELQRRNARFAGSGDGIPDIPNLREALVNG
ncbi:MAG: helix-turn-helix transcriptional regulator [Verrucomicrobia bacterium]|nr:helix-turn-helix transcriptional regulator [Verrucomicrobiota bacterium]